jgi:hypothetical protein
MTFRLEILMLVVLIAAMIVAPRLEGLTLDTAFNHGLTGLGYPHNATGMHAHAGI